MHDTRSTLLRSLLALLVAQAAPLSQGACSRPVADIEAPEVVPLGVEVVDSTIVFGGALLLDVTDANLLRPNRVTVTAEGETDGQPVYARMDAMVESRGSLLRVVVPWLTLTRDLHVGTLRIFSGRLTVEVEDLGTKLSGVGAVEDVELDFVEGLIPVLFPPQAVSVYLNEVIEIPAGGLLREQEGVNSILVWGEMVTDRGRKPVNTVLPVTLAGESREVARVRLLARAFGVEPGVCECDLIPRNQRSGERLEIGPSSPIELRVKRTEVDAVDPLAAGRGEFITVVGRGLVPPDPEAGISMFFRLEGQLETVAGPILDLTGDSAVLIPPDDVPSFTEARVALRTEAGEDEDGLPVLTGVSANPGEFRGTITPVMVEADRLVDAGAWSGSITITAPYQYVYIKFLPSFTGALEDFGLRNVETEVRARVLEVVRRDFGGVGIRFEPTRPTEFVEYSIIEVGGPDPNGAGLFGLDNTEGKDVGNLRLDDIVGGENADVREQGYLSFGGVFIASFTAFSPTLNPEHAASDAMFDTIFAPFMPALGGASVEADEWPDGPRAALIAEAIRVLGNLIGDSLSHEAGHSLGLAFYPDDGGDSSSRYHNPDDEVGAIMDEGVYRPFGERAELPGFLMPRFNDVNRAYLERVLPPRE